MPEPLPHLSLTLKHRAGALQIDAAFKLTQPWTVLFGPSGSGKSTILRAIAGLFQPHHAKIELRWEGRDQLATHTVSQTFVPPHQRFVRWAAQRPALFPHLTVLENLRLAVEDASKGGPPAEELALDCFRIRALAAAKPGSLSGGEQQRVSLARAAIASNGRLLLLDEPFTGLDAPLRDTIIASLHDWLDEHRTPVLSVTHDIGEAFHLDAEVIKLDRGRVTHKGPAATVLAEEGFRLLQQLRHRT